jgi:hypothetical protein
MNPSNVRYVSGKWASQAPQIRGGKISELRGFPVCKPKWPVEPSIRDILFEILIGKKAIPIFTPSPSPIIHEMETLIAVIVPDPEYSMGLSKFRRTIGASE